MSDDILAQVIADLISSPANFSLQLDESTDVSYLSQLVVFVRCERHHKGRFLFCKPLTTPTKAANVKKLVDDFFRQRYLVEYGFCSLLEWISSHAGTTLWFWSAGETRCTTQFLSIVSFTGMRWQQKPCLQIRHKYKK